ncbi:MAG TPA: hypothetical protein VK249_06200 [Anaerolineales bacterium]|nr:hypothetical protein [Anaerolineales bacterium]
MVTQNCGNAQACVQYILEMQSDSQLYKLAIPEPAYKKMKIHACYAVTYYPGNHLSVENSNPEVLLPNITRIESAVCPATD